MDSKYQKYFDGGQIVEAVQWEGCIESEELISEFTQKEITFTDNPDFIIVIIERGVSSLLLDIGDYVVKDTNGELKAVEGELFNIMFEEI